MTSIAEKQMKRSLATCGLKVAGEFNSSEIFHNRTLPPWVLNVISQHLRCIGQLENGDIEVNPTFYTGGVSKDFSGFDKKFLAVGIGACNLDVKTSTYRLPLSSFQLKIELRLNQLTDSIDKQTKKLAEDGCKNAARVSKFLEKNKVLREVWLRIKAKYGN